MTHPAQDFEIPLSNECDLVMKGGITSGVVYPRTLVELALKYRFRNIGGTSAGAIAAGLAAAAEYNRQAHGSGAGFAHFQSVVAYLQQHLLDLFQPDPRHKKSFKLLLDLVADGKNPITGFFSALRSIPKIVRLVKTVKALPETYFALCPGCTQKNGPVDAAGTPVAGLTDWLNTLLETLAGRMEGGALPATPLTFRDLEQHGITLRTITTSLGTQNPVLLPFSEGGWMARGEDLDTLFPRNVAAYLQNKDREDEDYPGYYELPSTDELPVLFGIRASLSFPILLAALPLYRRDYTHRLDHQAMKIPRLCWLSDGGITSNFPIHLFDSPLPSRPTFGLSLESYSPTKHDPDPANLQGRVYMHSNPGKGLQRPVHEISGLGGFLGAILDSARNWQDSLQTVMPGYRERIVHVALTDKEGGLNLDMDPAVVGNLTEFGAIAGQKLTTFDLEEHQWRRLLATYAALEVALGGLAEKLPAFKQSLAGYQPKSYKPTDQAELDELWNRMQALVDAAKPMAENPIRESWGPSNNMPSPASYVKLVPKVQAGRN